MLLGQVFERFIKESPVSVMVRGLLEKALWEQILDERGKDGNQFGANRTLSNR